MSHDHGTTERIWIIPSEGGGHEQHVDAAARADLLARGYTEVRVQCQSGPRKGDYATMFIQSKKRPNIEGAIALEAAKSLLGCESMQVFRVEGSQFLP